MTSNVSVYVLRERLHETYEKRQALKAQEEEILAGAIQGYPFADRMTEAGSSMYDQTLSGIVENTEGYEKLQSWRSRYLTRQ
jgi:hypothetical protein